MKTIANILKSILGPNYQVRLLALLQFVAQTGWNYYTSITPPAIFDWHIFTTSLIGGIILFFTKGAGVTGGTIPATTEAENRLK